MSFRCPKNKIAKFERSAPNQQVFYSDILHNQQNDANGDFPDMVLVCNGGTIRIHAFILQAASPLIQEAIFSQGENYPYVREILLPDFSVKEIERMLTVVYKGGVDSESQEEVQSLKDTLSFFQIKNFGFGNGEEREEINGFLKVDDLNRIPQDIFKPEPKGGRSDKPTVVKESSRTLRRSGRSTKAVVADSNVSSDDSDEDSDKETRTRGRKTSKKGTAKTQPVAIVRLPRVENPSPVKSAPSAPAANGTRKKAEDSSGTDSEDEGWVQPNFKDKEWFAKESRRCQSCDKTYDRPAEASLCITSHKSLRCYFCFKVYSSTDILFKHFRRRHRQAGRENCLICPYCDQAVPYKSVSCHVISVHLRTKPEDKGANKSRSSSVSSTSSSSAKKSIDTQAKKSTPTKRSTSSSTERNPPKKKLKSSEKGKDTEEEWKPKTPTKKKKSAKRKKKGEKEMVKLAVKDLDMTIEKITKIGTTLVFRLQKKRPAILINQA